MNDGKDDGLSLYRFMCNQEGKAKLWGMKTDELCDEIEDSLEQFILEKEELRK